MVRGRTDGGPVAWQHLSVADDTHDTSQDDVLARVFPGADAEDETSGPDSGTSGTSVDERRQRLLEPLGDPDREPW